MVEIFEKLQVPGLVLAAGVIWLLFGLVGKTIDFSMELLRQRSEERALITEMAAMLRQICGEVKSGRGK